MPSGITPTMVAGTAFRRIDAPDDAGSLPYRCFQTLRADEHDRRDAELSSSGAKSRPSSGATPEHLEEIGRDVAAGVVLRHAALVRRR